MYSYISTLWKVLRLSFAKARTPLFYQKLPKLLLQNLPKQLLFTLPCSMDVKEKLVETKINPYDIEENLSHLMALAKIQLEKGDTERAEAIIEMGIKICEDYRSYFSLPYMYDILASIAFALGNLNKAEEILVSAVEKLVQLGFEENDSHIIDYKLRLARIYSSYDQFTLAEIGFKSCLTEQKEKIHQGDTSMKTGMLYVNTLFWYGLHKIRNQEFMSAKRMINTAYDFSMKIKGLSPYQEMVILYTLGDLNMQLGNYDIALQNMQGAILLGKGIGSLDMPRCYLKLARVYLNLGALDKCMDAASESKRLAALFNEYDVEVEAEDILSELAMKNRD